MNIVWEREGAWNPGFEIHFARVNGASVGCAQLLKDGQYEWVYLGQLGKANTLQEAKDAITAMAVANRMTK